MRKVRQLFVFSLVLMLMACGNQSDRSEKYSEISMVDPDATAETRALMANLLKYQDEALMFGHQDDLAYGIGWWGEVFNSDVQMVTGKYPAVFGWDLGEIGQDRNIDSVLFSDMQRWMIEACEQGGINTVSLHLDNPVTGGNSWDTTPAVHAIIPGGELHEQFKVTLDVVAVFLERLRTGDGTYVPVIFRPWHELNGSWFWWGRDNCSVEDFKKLFRFTVEYLRDEKGLHHLLYSYSTDRFSGEEEYLERYPGDEYVDLLGYDDYHSFTRKSEIPNGINSLRILAELSKEKDKPFALTEMGLESIPVPEWWTEHVLGPIKADSLARKASYMLVWRNARLDHHYAPYPGHVSEEQFKIYEADPFTWFLEDLPDMYQ